MVPDIDPPPDYELIGNRKGKRAEDSEKVEIHRLNHSGMSLQQIMEITQRSEDSIRKYIREIDAFMDAQVRTRAEAYDHMTNPAPPPPPPSEAPAPAAPVQPTGGPPPPSSAAELEIEEPPEMDLDDLFEEEEIVDPGDPEALPKKLYVELLKRKAVKTEDEARDIAATWRLFPDYQNAHGLVEFLRGNDVKERKATLIARMVFGWKAMNEGQGQQGFNPPPAPGYGYGQPPGTPGFNQYTQPWGGGMGVGQYPTYPGQPQMPFPYPPPFQQPQPQPESKGISKTELKDLLDRREKQLHEHYEKVITKDREKREQGEEKKQLLDTVNQLQAQITEMKMNPQAAPPPDGNYQSIEEPEFDEEGNVVRVVTKHIKLEDPVQKQIEEKYDKLLAELKEERKDHKEEMKAILDQRNALELDKIRAENEGKLSLWEEKKAHLEAVNDKMTVADKELRAKELEILEMKYKNSDEQPIELQKVDKQIQVLREIKDQAKDARKDAMNFIMVMSGRGRPAGVVEEQWTDEELAGLKQ